jgi:hypothetical protein
MMDEKKTAAIASLMLIALCAAWMPTSARAVEVIKDGENTLNVDGRLQLLGALEGVDDPWKDSERLFMFLKQARLDINGTAKGTDYRVQWMLGGEEVPERNSVMSLLDAYVDLPLLESLRLRLGQFMVPNGRERMIESGDAFNTSRSIHNNYFNIGRDVGLLVHGETGSLVGALGLFTGGGINIPQRYIPEDLEIPLMVGRFGINTGVDNNVLTPANVVERGENGFAAYVNGAYTKDSRVGHSTPLNVKYYDKSLMLNSDWNPYIGASGQKAEFWQAGVDVAAQVSLCDTCDLLLSGEYNVADFSNDAGSLQTSGGALSANLIMENLVLGLRYALVDPDSNMAYVSTDEDTGEKTSYAITNKQIQEITPSIVYFLREHNVRLIADVAIQLDVPVSLETGHGVYNLMRQADQISYASKGGIELQDNYLASLIVQYDF